jgi:5-(carboxyamino)imidazole ribonucleotide mutase
MARTRPLVGIVMGSTSDWGMMEPAARQLKEFGIPYDAKALSAHRSPDALNEWIEASEKHGVRCFIAAAGGAAHLAGVIAAKTTLPVLGVPMPSKHLQGLDSLLSMVQMPKGIPVATFAIGEAGAANAALFAVSMLALSDANLAKKLEEFRDRQTKAVLAAKLPE